MLCIKLTYNGANKTKKRKILTTNAPFSKKEKIIQKYKFKKKKNFEPKIIKLQLWNENTNKLTIIKLKSNNHAIEPHYLCFN